MKDGIKQIMGKTIKGVVVKEDIYPSESQVFLIFTDGTYYEFYSKKISGTSEVDRGGLKEIKDYMPVKNIIFEAHDENNKVKTIEEQVKGFLDFLNCRIERYRDELQRFSPSSDTGWLIKEKLTEAEAISGVFHHKTIMNS